MESVLVCIPLWGLSTSASYCLYELGQAQHAARQRANDVSKVLSSMIEPLSQMVTTYMSFVLGAPSSSAKGTGGYENLMQAYTASDLESVRSKND